MGYVPQGLWLLLARSKFKAFLYGEAGDKIMALFSLKVKLSLSNILHCQTIGFFAPSEICLISFMCVHMIHTRLIQQMPECSCI